MVRSPAHPARLVVLLLFLAGMPLLAQTKSIRLRNETITTPAPPAPGARALRADAPPVSGLFLLQFELPPDAALRERLIQAGVDLLRYVPDDAYIAHFEKVEPAVLQALPGVRWWGDYRSEWRVARRLRDLAAAGQALDVSLALSPRATPQDRVLLRRTLQRLSREAPTRFGAILTGRVTPTQLALLSRSPAVLWIEPAPQPRLFDEIASKIVGGGEYTTGEPGDDFPGLGGGGGEDDDDDFGSLTGVGVGGLPGIARPLSAPAPSGLPSAEHLTTTQKLGFDGTGVTVSVADSGLHNGDAESMHPDLAGRVDAFFFYGRLEDASDEHSHGTHVTGIVAGNGATGETDEFGNLYGLGVAPGAHIVAQRIFDGVGNYEAPPTYETLTRDAVRAGAVIASNSWGDDTQGRYDLSAAEFDALVRDADELTPGDQPYIMEFSAGNAGPGSQTIGSPAVAKNVIATGAAQNDRYGFFLFEDGPEAMADFSSRGPCEDGRFKPDIVAPGTWIASLQSESATDENAWLPISSRYQFQGGTSQSGPHASGAAAVFVQYWRETQGGFTPSPALVKAALINSATDLDDEAGGTEPIPNHDEGWGRITLTNLIGSPRRFEYVDQSVALTNRQVYERRILVGQPWEPLKVTLAYTDVPGLPAAVPALVNDLDLEVVGPDGTLYRGNAFFRGESIPNALAADFLNNVEGVHLLNPTPGEYVVRVRGSRVVEDIRRRPGANPVQDFALFVSADIPLPGQGILVLDRQAYTAPATVGIRLIDFDLRGAPSATVTVSTETEPAGEPVTLLPFGTTGVFTGAVATLTGPPGADGRLQVAHGNTLRARYADASPPADRITSADIDLVAPILTDVQAATRFGRLLVAWESDEPADSIVDFGPTVALGSSLTNRSLDTAHLVPIDGFATGQTVFYRVRSRDAAGNESTLGNGSQPFQAVVAASATLLLVNHFSHDILLGDTVTLAGYTDALDAVGVDYEIWDVDLEGRTPKFEELRNYPVVIWRVAEFVPALGTQEVKAIRDFVDAGGGLFMASMELLSRLDEGGFSAFRRAVLNVDSFDIDPGLGGVYGSDNVSMTSGIETPLDFSEYPDFFGLIPQDLSDTFQPTTNAVPILFDADTSKAVGIRYPRTGGDGRGRVVFFAFPFDTLPLDGDSPNNRVELLRRVLGFLDPSTGLPTLELDREEYALPAVAAIEVSDARLADRSSATVVARTEREPTGVPLELGSSGEPGRFRGFLRLVPDTNAPAAGQVRARDGDLLEILYDAGPLGGEIRVAGVIDTAAAEIHGITIEPAYTEAVIRWTTSEPTDGLAQYRDLGFPSNFTSYHPDFRIEHELRLTGLEPDRDYEVELTCRDPAGNTSRDDNAGKYHRFRTLKPLSPPFIDDLERGATNWTVADSALDSETLSLLVSSTWELGRPANALATAARSGVACWSTNLRGDANDYADSSLVSPAILLQGGNRATLRFWHHYDFLPRSEDLDIIEVGGVYVTTNNGAAWTPLIEYGEASDGWEPVELDLSAYLGRTIRIGWAYGLLSLDSIEHPGWLVDDIAVTVDTYVPASLVISNNLHQASVTLQGATSTRTERGRLTVLTNLPPGDYQLSWAAVPYHETPAARTVTLAGGATVRVAGTYTFPDTNANGLSDLWEQVFLGGARPGHTPDTDTDGDGLSDLAEFFAGSNPTNAVSRLTLLPPRPTPTGDLQLRWESAAGRGYRVQGSADAQAWVPMTAWQRAAGTSSTAVVPLPAGEGEPYLFRLEVEP